MVSICAFAVVGPFLSSLDNAQIDELDPDFMSFKFDLTFFNKSGIAFVVTIFNWPKIRQIGCFSSQNSSKKIMIICIGKLRSAFENENSSLFVTKSEQKVLTLKNLL